MLHDFFRTKVAPPASNMLSMVSWRMSRSRFWIVLNYLMCALWGYKLIASFIWRHSNASCGGVSVKSCTGHYHQIKWRVHRPIYVRQRTFGGPPIENYKSYRTHPSSCYMRRSYWIVNSHHHLMTAAQPPHPADMTVAISWWTESQDGQVNLYTAIVCFKRSSLAGSIKGQVGNLLWRWSKVTVL